MFVLWKVDKVLLIVLKNKASLILFRSLIRIFELNLQDTFVRREIFKQA